MKQEKFYMVVTGSEVKIDGETVEAINPEGIYTDINKAKSYYQEAKKKIGEDDVTSVSIEEYITEDGVIKGTTVLDYYPKQIVLCQG